MPSKDGLPNADIQVGVAATLNAAAGFDAPDSETPSSPFILLCGCSPPTAELLKAAELLCGLRILTGVELCCTAPLKAETLLSAVSAAELPGLSAVLCGWKMAPAELPNAAMLLWKAKRIGAALLLWELLG